jgi:hypothetical protein
MMMLQVGNRMAHMLFSREQRLLPNRFAVPPDSTDAMESAGNVADEELRTETLIAPMESRPKRRNPSMEQTTTTTIIITTMRCFKDGRN